MGNGEVAAIGGEGKIADDDGMQERCGLAVPEVNPDQPAAALAFRQLEQNALLIGGPNIAAKRDLHAAGGLRSGQVTNLKCPLIHKVAGELTARRNAEASEKSVRQFRQLQAAFSVQAQKDKLGGSLEILFPLHGDGQ